jgi:predicted metal-dependent hydrolase
MGDRSTAPDLYGDDTSMDPIDGMAPGVNPASVTVKNYKSRWGSCSTKGDISYNWRIILAPHSIVDYVVVHELCHMLEHNHSSKYWKHVERHVPNWRECREWLKHNELAKDL